MEFGLGVNRLFPGDQPIFDPRPRHDVATANRTTVDPFTSSRRARAVQAAIDDRTRRGSYFKASLFSDPAWDILLELFAADLENRQVSMSGVGLVSGVPLTTALRWINVLQQQGLVARDADPLDRRRSFLDLTDAGKHAMREYFAGTTYATQFQRRSSLQCGI